jgi:NAD(P)-dependent dehydrogenase (short-subunit alcohol dehydrogenase family)
VPCDEYQLGEIAAPLLLTQRLLPMLTSGWPSAPRSLGLNIGSMDGLRPPEHDAYAYAASKVAIHPLTQMMATALGQHGVLVNALAPGTFTSHMSAERMERKGSLTPCSG